jgi:putative tricarboxylic transport membrane protein
MSTEGVEEPATADSTGGAGREDTTDGSGAAAAASPPVASTRTVEIVAAALLLGFAGLMGFDNWRTGMGWAPDGPKAGYFPFYLSVILGCASLYWLVEAGLKRRSSASPPKAFLRREQLVRVLQVFVPAALFCGATQLLGVYVASFLLIAGFMRWVGRIAWWKSIVTSLVFAASMFAVFDMAFDVLMPKGPLEALFGR